MGKLTTYNILVALAVALGSLTYGYSISILGNTLGKPIFYVYMKLDTTGPGAGHATAIIAWWNCILYAGGFFGCASTFWFATRSGRRMPIAVGAAFAALGSALQAGSVNPEMMIVARAILGIGVGFLLSGVPLYQAEIAPPSSRGLVVGLHAVASWIGVAFFHVDGQTGWRVPLALQTVFPLTLFLLVWFLPESPRWLYMNGRGEEAEKVLIRLHRNQKDPNNEFARKEMYIIKAQIDHELSHRLTLAVALKTPSMRKRFILGWATMSCTQASGLIVVLTYQAVIYGSLGFSPFMIGILASIWCICNGTGNFIGGTGVDYFGRVRLIICGLASCMVTLVLLCVLTKKYAGTTNRGGNIAAAVLTFLLIIFYTVGVEAAAFVYTSELFPGEWRALGVSTSITAVFFWGCIFTAVASPAFANIGPLYYIVFISCSTLMIFVAGFFFPETKGFTLEQIAAVFGDDVVDMQGRVEHGQDFVKEHEDLEHVELGQISSETVTNIEKSQSV
ncbi:hypothetical protein AYO22_03018 [Fonsecaea multimorphosa]|nr:hypothetical protein AYO22_03018 [Fonsecaea multimorphosa]